MSWTIYFHLLHLTVLTVSIWLMANVSSCQTHLVTGMRLKYSIPQLLNYNNHTVAPACIAAIKGLGLLRRPRYIHRSSRRKFVYHQSVCSASRIKSIWTDVAGLTRHQSNIALGVGKMGITARRQNPELDCMGNNVRSLFIEQDIKRGVDFNVLQPLQRCITSSMLKIELFNAQSLSNKSSLVNDHIMEKGLDLMCLTETWHQPEVYSPLNEVCPPGYSYLEKARTTGRGGGLAIIYRQKVELYPLPLPILSSFECFAFKCKPPFPMTILLIYRPPKLNSVFISEIHDLLTTLCSTTGNILILGDFNIHIDTPSCNFAVEFLQLLDCLDLQQHIDVPTHSRGHTLDLVISNFAPICNLLVYDLGVSDHKVISMELPLPCSLIKVKRQMCFRNLKKINLVSLAIDLQQLSSADFSSVTESVDFYNRSLSSLLDIHAPVKTRTVTFSRSAPWFTCELRKMKEAGRVLERRLKVTGLPVHRQAYREHQKAFAKSLRDARSRFYSGIINNNSGNSKQLFSTIHHLLKPQAHPHLEATKERCDTFIVFFRKKVDNIRSFLSSSSALPVLTADLQPETPQPLCCFSDISQQEVEDKIRKMKPSTCTLDPFPTALVKSNLCAISPLITKVINHSL